MTIFLKLILILIISKNVNANPEIIPEIVISPNKVNTQIDKTGSSIIFIDEYELEQTAASNLSDVLQQHSSFSVSNKGGLGADPSYHNRGLARKYIKIFIDGMDISDITAPQEEPTYINNFNLNDIKSIEVLNGSQGTLYGSNAIAGVINLNSEKPYIKGLLSNFFIETGSFGTLKVGNSFDYLNEKTLLRLNLNGEKSNGFSSYTTDTESFPLEKDGYDFLSGKILFDYFFNENTEFNFVLRNSYHENEYDDIYSSPIDTSSTHGIIRQFSSLASISHKSNNFKHKFTIQPSQSSRINRSPTTFEYDSLRKTIEYLLYTDINRFTSLTNGINYMKLNADMNGEIAEKKNYAFFSELRLKPTKNINIDLSARREFDEDYGEFDTGRLQTNYALTENLILKSSLGNGYRSPGMYELYSSLYGNTNLTPEDSLSTDISMIIQSKKFNFYFNTAYFTNDIGNKINFIGSGYTNTVGKTHIKGYENIISFDITDSISFNNNYTQTNGKDENGNRLKLVPKHKLVTSLRYVYNDYLNLNVYNIYNSRTNDPYYKELPTYKSLNLRANYELNENTKFYLKLENIIDRTNMVNRYSIGGGYTSPQKAVYLGVKTNLF